MNCVERVKQICKERKIPISKLEKDLGFSNGYVGQLKKGSFPAERLSKIADYLSLSPQYLMYGEEPAPDPVLTSRDERDIEKILARTKEQLLSQEGLMFDGDPASPEAIDSILSAMQIGMELAKKKNKEKGVIRIDIAGDCAIDMHKELNMYGITKDFIYPELTSFTEVMRDRVVDKVTKDFTQHLG